MNNAGTINKNNKIWEVPEEEFDAVIDTNLKGTANMLRHFIPLMIESKQGVIVNISSGWGRSAAAQVKSRREAFYLITRIYDLIILQPTVYYNFQIIVEHSDH